ncbi:ribonuclease [Comamonas sp. MYb21]|uniref:ribonuclease n=1 Tax=Comamonas sp. MYb21 TaxID=1848648 RepID=UPI0030A0D2F7
MLKAWGFLARSSVKAGVLAVVMAALPPGVQARGSGPSAFDGPVVAVAELPPQGRKTYVLIYEGGPFPYDKDGSVFGNRERILPRHPRGYYREYTVKTPGSRDRGARRIICGGQVATMPDTCYYTQDHYSSFRRIVN